MSHSKPNSTVASDTTQGAQTLDQLFLQTVARRGASVAFADERGELTYGQMGAVARAFAHRLDTRLAGEVETSENVAILVPTVKEFPATYFGILLSGRTPVPINYLLEERELKLVLADSAVNTVIASRHFAKMIEGKLPRVHFIEDLTLEQVAAAANHVPARAPAPDDVATLLYTSGTTGVPKGVELTHRNLIANIEGSRRAIDVTENDVLLGALPLFHSFALTVTMNLIVALGARAYYLPRFAGRKALDLLSEQKITMLPLVASMFRLLNRSAGRAEGLEHSLRLALAGGEPLPGDVAEEFEQIFGIELLEGYGLTETSPVLCLDRPGCNRRGTVGLPLDNLEIAILDDAGVALGCEQDGEICARGPSIMRGYRNQPDATREVIDVAGWFHTGDIGRFDADGFLRITGRKKEMILSGGENIFPREIEDVLSSHEAVFEAAVIAIPDKMRGEVPYAFVALHEGAQVTGDDLKSYLRGRIADYKLPRAVELRAELPHSPTGKILKRSLKPGS